MMIGRSQKRKRLKIQMNKEKWGEKGSRAHTRGWALGRRMGASEEKDMEMGNFISLVARS